MLRALRHDPARASVQPHLTHPSDCAAGLPDRSPRLRRTLPSERRHDTGSERDPRRSAHAERAASEHRVPPGGPEVGRVVLEVARDLVRPERRVRLLDQRGRGRDVRRGRRGAGEAAAAAARERAEGEGRDRVGPDEVRLDAAVDRRALGAVRLELAAAPAHGAYGQRGRRRAGLGDAALGDLVLEVRARVDEEVEPDGPGGDAMGANADRVRLRRPPTC